MRVYTTSSKTSGTCFKLELCLTLGVNSILIPHSAIIWSTPFPTSFLQALHAQYLHCYDLQAYHLLHAEQWNEAHTVIIDELIPDAFINGEGQPGRCYNSRGMSKQYGLA